MGKIINVGVRLDDGAFMPTRGHDADAGLDLRAKDYTYVGACESAVFDTGVHLSIPEGWAGLVVAKSGLNVNNSILTTGLIDANFTGSIRLRLYNHSEQGLSFHEGEKIGQIMFVRIPVVNLVLDEVLSHELRGDDGYGSTGR